MSTQTPDKPKQLQWWQKKLAEQEAMIAELGGGVTLFRKLLGTLPLPGALLLAGAYAEQARMPGYQRMPATAYEGVDFWTVSVSSGFGPRNLRLSRFKDYCLVQQAQERTERATDDLTQANIHIRNLMATLRNEPPDSSASVSLTAKVAEWTAKAAKAQAIIDSDGTAEHSETVWEIAFDEVI